MDNVGMRLIRFQLRQVLKETIELHRHNEYEVHYLTEGRCRFQIGRSVFLLLPGSFLVVPPGLEHRLLASGRLRVAKYSFLTIIGPEEKKYDNLLRRVIRKGPIKPGRELRYFFEELRRKSASPEPAARQSANHQFLSFLYDIIAEGGLDRRRDSKGHIEYALGYMHRHLHDEIDLRRLALKMSLTPSYLVRLFKKQLGLPPMKYFMQRKIEGAQQFLAETRWPVKRIARQMGFSDEFYFSRVFKKWTGLSPTRYREMAGQTISDPSNGKPQSTARDE